MSVEQKIRELCQENFCTQIIELNKAIREDFANLREEK